jgi:hypothetical protein
MTELITTLNKIREHAPCASGWKTLLKSLNKETADNEPLSFRTIFESNGLDDALWCTRAAPEYAKEWRLYAVWCARRVQHLITDERSTNAIDVAERYANGRATEEELTAAHAVALRALQGRDVAEAATRTAVEEATLRAAWATRRIAQTDVAYKAAWEGEQIEVAWEAAWEEERAAQEAKFLRVITGSTN